MAATAFPITTGKAAAASKLFDRSSREVVMRAPILLTSLLLLMCCGTAIAGGTVGFNVKWYSTGQWPFNGIVDPPGFEATTGIVLADLNGIPDVAYSYSCCGNGSGGGVSATITVN
jgi:hypothetical protein